MLLEIVPINAEIERRIDWVGEANHPQPEDPLRSGRVYNTRQPSFTPNTIGQNYHNDDDDDLQQKQQPIFGKGTYLEFTQPQQLSD